MANRNKLQKFAELATFSNVYENFNPLQPKLTAAGGHLVDLRGSWRSEHFKNDHPLTLELACGRGEYTVELARRYPHRNFIGVDVKGARIWRGAKDALAEGLDNAAFLRGRIEPIASFFEPGEVDEIWITFPDPFRKKGKANRRLTAAGFLREYRKILKPGGIIHLKTDSQLLYNWTLAYFAHQAAVEVLYHDNDIYSKPLPQPELDIQTYYERMHRDLGEPITYIRFRLHEDIPFDFSRGLVEE
ncbi:MAG: tRNA (guanosine(46)-N7)-methyltransferase TrmB [Bacteroidota bacterium]